MDDLSIANFLDILYQKRKTLIIAILSLATVSSVLYFATTQTHSASCTIRKAGNHSPIPQSNLFYRIRKRVISERLTLTVVAIEKQLHMIAKQLNNETDKEFSMAAKIKEKTSISISISTNAEDDRPFETINMIAKIYNKLEKEHLAQILTQLIQTEIQSIQYSINLSTKLIEALQSSPDDDLSSSKIETAQLRTFEYKLQISAYEDFLKSLDKINSQAEAGTSSTFMGTIATAALEPNYTFSEPYFPEKSNPYVILMLILFASSFIGSLVVVASTILSNGPDE